MLQFFNTEIKPLSDRLAQMIADKKDVKHIVVYEQQRGPHGTLINVPVNKVKSLKTLGLSLEEVNE